MPGGKFAYFGIQEQLGRYNFDVLVGLDRIEFDFNIDGLPLYKSSRKCLWPIMGAIVNQRDIPPFVVAIYEGETHPHCSNDFLKEFSEELDLLQKNGVKFGREAILKPFQCRAFICDAQLKLLLSRS